MHLQRFRVKNYRRLLDVSVSLDDSTSIFVGANNSGKTSAAKIFSAFTKHKNARFSFYDFRAACWTQFDLIGDKKAAEGSRLPTIALDLWFSATVKEAHRVLKILPSLDWKGEPVGMRLEFAPKNEAELLANFWAARELAQKNVKKENGKQVYHPWPESLCDYLKKRLTDEYKINFFALDHNQFDVAGKEKPGYQPLELGDQKESGHSILESLLKIHFLDAQRFQSDEDMSRPEGLSKRLSRFYERNLEQFNEDFQAVAALAGSEEALNEHFRMVFGETLQRLSKLGYPGFANPDLVIRSAFDPESLLTRNASVHYALRDPGKQTAEKPALLPDKYNGLGFKNLIYMVIEVLDFHHQWADEKEKRPPVHLVFIEEPEAHLHAQLQQVFIRQIREVLPKESEAFATQFVISTHSPHITYEAGFQPIRYFRRIPNDHSSDVQSLSAFYDAQPESRDFLSRYMKLTHCDLFFADAAILVEGNVERLLLPSMIESVAPGLNACYLSVLEVGGAFAHKFESLLRFIGLTTLVITDLDSVQPRAKAAPDEDTEEGRAQLTAGGEPESGACLSNVAGAVTSNQVLRTWLPKIGDIAGLLALDDKDKCAAVKKGEVSPPIRVAYQTKTELVWGDDKKILAGRTFEEAFAFENLKWCQDKERKGLGLVVRSTGKSLDEIALAIHDKVKSTSFKKTDFALALLSEKPEDWKVPKYIAEGLKWLVAETVPAKLEPPVADQGTK